MVGVRSSKLWGGITVLLAMLSIGSSAGLGKTIHVKVGGTGDGSSWANAYGDLQPALDDADPNDEIWVAAGTYRPTSDYGLGIGDRGKHFRMKNRVAIYGGFAATGSPGWDDRDTNKYETILSGDLSANDGPVADAEDLIDDPNRSENCYHVFYHPEGTDLDPKAVVDGFTVADGNASGDGSDYPYNHTYHGGGICNYSSSPTVTGCTFRGNSADYCGGGMCNFSSTPAVTGCTFSDNIAYRGYGGGMGNRENSTPTVTECMFSSNSAGYCGGGMYNYSSSPTVSGCTFSENWALRGTGGGMGSYGGSPTITNCTFSRNSAMFRGCGMYNNNSSPAVTDCTFIENSGLTLGGGMYNGNGSKPVLTNCTFTGNSAHEGGGLENYSCSPILINCTFNNNHATSNGGGMFNWLSSDPTLINCTFSGNSASGDGGAICNEHTSSPTLTNCVFVGNSAEWAGGIVNYGSPILVNCIFCGNSAVKDGGGIYVNSGKATLSNCILWDNSDRGGSDEPAQISRYSGSLAVNYNCVQGWTGSLGGTGNIDADPCFADPGYWDPNGTPEDTTDDFWVDGGYHLKSQAGRWDANEGGWTTDDVTSSCIDAGDPMSAVGPEPFPNGGIVNMGAYGATGEASKSYFGEPPCEIIVAGDVNGDCLVNFLDFRLMALYWCEDNNP